MGEGEGHCGGRGGALWGKGRGTVGEGEDAKGGNT